jgi:hypothetical protein
VGQMAIFAALNLRFIGQVTGCEVHIVGREDGVQRMRAPRGERAYGNKVPRDRGANTILIASMTFEGAMGETMMTVEGCTDRFVFEAYYVEHFLAPSLEENLSLPYHEDRDREVPARCSLHSIKL